MSNGLVEEGSEEALKLRKWTEEGGIKLVVSEILLSECARGLKKAEWEDDEIYEVYRYSRQTPYQSEKDIMYL